MTDDIRCTNCGQKPTLETEGQYDLLHVSCGCKGRYVNVKNTLPQEWSAWIAQNARLERVGELLDDIEELNEEIDRKMNRVDELLEEADELVGDA